MTATFHPRPLHTGTLHTGTLHTGTLHTGTLHTGTLHTGTLRPDRSDIVPNYAGRRLMVAVLALALLAMGAIAVLATVGALVDLGGRPAAASEIPAPGSESASAPSVHVAAAGDTLWSIAEQYRGGVSRDRYVDALISLNGGTSIQVGQPVALP